jgi:hypothetical protein
MAQTIRSAFGAGEHEHGCHLLCTQKLQKELHLQMARNGVDRVADAHRRCGSLANLHGRGMVQDLVCKGPYLRRHGCGKHQILAFRWQQAQDLLDVRQKTHVEHPVCLIQDQHF